MICRGTVTIDASGAVHCSRDHCDCHDLETAALCHSVFLFGSETGGRVRRRGGRLPGRRRP